MTEILFYHLQRQPLESVLPSLLERSVERGWRVVVQMASDERVEALDAHLWTYRDESFLPHGTPRDGEAAAQPILLTTGEDNPNAATVRFLLLFDGDDEDALAQARARWSEAKAQGFDVTYWQTDERGRWVKKA
jgi:DNA polymerase-3 subunit chi